MIWKTCLQLVISNSTKYFSLRRMTGWLLEGSQQGSSNQACLSTFSKIMHQSSYSAQNGPNPTNKSLPKFTPIFLILPQTLVVCQNWLASNLEKDILRKCQKCRRMEDNVGCSARLLEQCISKSLTNLHHNNIHVPRLLMHRISIKRLGNIFSKAQEWMVLALLPKLPQLLPPCQHRDSLE